MGGMAGLGLAIESEIHSAQALRRRPVALRGDVAPFIVAYAVVVAAIVSAPSLRVCGIRVWETSDQRSENPDIRQQTEKGVRRK